MQNNRKASRIHSKLVDLILGGTTTIDGDAFGLKRTSMWYWRTRARLKLTGRLNCYEVTEESVAWAKNERDEMATLGARRVAAHEARKLKMREYAREYYAKHREQCRETNRAWAAKNVEHVREYNRRWRDQHPESFLDRKLRRLRSVGAVA